MIAKFAKKINEILIQKGIVQKEDAELYQYGIENGIVVASLRWATATRPTTITTSSGLLTCTWWAKRSCASTPSCGPPC